MTRVSTPPRLSAQPLGFHTYVIDAISDWEALYQREVAEFDEELETRDPNVAPPLHPSVDRLRAELLQRLITEFFVSFKGWCAEEVLAFALIACPRQNIANLTSEGLRSELLAEIYENWKPSFIDWAYFLWELTGRACELFADVLYLLPTEQKPDNPDLGKVLFKDLIERELIHPRACASLMGALIPYPYQTSYARKHEETIESYSRKLGPTEIGLMCRSLILYRSRDNEHCQCGYEYGQYECECAKEAQRRGGGTRVTDPLAYDLDKEYAFVLMKLILNRNDFQVLEDDFRWTQQDRDEFVRSACEEVFSEAIYTELYQNLHIGKEPTVKQQHARKITEAERRANITRSYDKDYDHSMAQHAGCVSRGCKQAAKTDCANVSCKQHCRRHGFLLCKAHRMYNVNALPHVSQRKNIRLPDERERRGRRFTQEREGDEI